MAFMVPGAEYQVAYKVETNIGTETVFECVCGEIEIEDGEPCDDTLEAYIEGKKVYSVERVEGWFANLSANGYMDQTDYMGPYDSAEEALKEVMDFYEVDENGDDLNDDS
jgi:hypothetical protein